MHCLLQELRFQSMEDCDTQSSSSQSEMGDMLSYPGVELTPFQASAGQSSSCVLWLEKKKMQRMKLLLSHGSCYRKQSGSSTSCTTNSRCSKRYGTSYPTSSTMHSTTVGEAANSKNQTIQDRNPSLFQLLRNNGVDEKLAYRRERIYMLLKEAISDLDA